MLNRRSLIQGALALTATALVLPKTDLITDAAEIRRQYWALDQTMLAPKPAHWMLAGTERRWGATRVLTMAGPLPSSLVVGDVVDVWGTDERMGRQHGYRAVVRAIGRMPDVLRRGAEDWRVEVIPVPSPRWPDPYAQHVPMQTDAISDWCYVNQVRRTEYKSRDAAYDR